MRVDKYIRLLGGNGDAVQLRATYIMYRDAFKKSKRVGDFFWNKYLQLEKELMRLTYQYIKESKDEVQGV
jgi:hypothetical protein